MTPPLKSYYVSGNALLETSESWSDIVDDPRGLVHVWEAPMQHARYIMGCDPSVGRTGWSRSTRVDDDRKTDNGAIEIFRVDAYKVPIIGKDGKHEIDPNTKQPRYYHQDVQVAEYAAPIDAVEIARVCNLLGRIYAGDQDDQCKLIYESYPGPGVLTTQELLRLGYANLWYWEYFADSTAEQSKRLGWQSSRTTQKLLWFRSRRHLMERRAYIKSRWLNEEYGNAVIDTDTMRAKAAYGSHDDRIQAANMCFWAGHEWTYDPERTWEPVTPSPTFDPQRYAPTIGDDHSLIDSWSDVIDRWAG